MPKLSIENIKLYALESGLVTEGTSGTLITAWLDHIDLTEELVDFARAVEQHTKDTQ